MKKVLMLFALVAFAIVAFPRTIAADPPDAIPIETVAADEAMPVQAVQPIDLQIVQSGDSIYVTVNGQSAAFCVPAESKAGKALGWTGIGLALILSLIAWFKSARLHRLARDKIN